VITIEHDARLDLTRMGYAWLPRPLWFVALSMEPHWRQLREDWNHLEPDRFLRDGATFRLRRYGRFSWDPAGDTLTPLPHEPYQQPADENPYAAGAARQFAPLLPATVQNPILHALVRCTYDQLPVDAEPQRWEVRIHQIRIVATPETPGLPAPEGIHQDGTDFLTLHMVGRHNVIGGETTIYDLARQPLFSYVMQDELDSVILQDPRVLHGVTPVHSADGRSVGTRDLLGIDFIKLS
jgi:hypothetical protein